LLTLYARLYCHLCEDMLQALRGLQPALGFELEVIDIDAHPALASRYGHLVPVLNRGEREICHYFLDENALRTCLAGA
jgi:thioredoxin reductase (NADPH)